MVVDPNGPPCVCGRRGCWERYASGSGLARLAREAATGGRLARVVTLAGDAEAVRGEHVQSAAARRRPRRARRHRPVGLVGGARPGEPHQPARPRGGRDGRRVWPRPGPRAGPRRAGTSPTSSIARRASAPTRRIGDRRRLGRAGGRHRRGAARRRPQCVSRVGARERPRISFQAASRPSKPCVVDVLPGSSILYMSKKFSISARRLGRELVEVLNVVPPGLRRRDAHDLGVGAGLVLHPHARPPAGPRPTAGERRVVEQHQRVERVAVLAEGVGEEAVVGRVDGGREQPPVEEDPPVSWSISYLLRLPRGISTTTWMQPSRGGFTGPSSQGMTTDRRRMAPVPLASMEFRRITNLPPYVFTIIDELKIEARRAGVDVDRPRVRQPRHPVARRSRSRSWARRPATRATTATRHVRGIPKLRQAVADLYPRNFGVDPRSGDRDHQHHRRQGGLQPPHVGAAAAGRRRPRARRPPTRSTSTARCSPAPTCARSRCATDEPDFFEGLDERRATTRWPKPRVIVLSFPHNPTGACVDLASCSESSTSAASTR